MLGVVLKPNHPTIENKSCEKNGMIFVIINFVLIFTYLFHWISADEATIIRVLFTLDSPMCGIEKCRRPLRRF